MFTFSYLLKQNKQYLLESLASIIKSFKIIKESKSVYPYTNVAIDYCFLVMPKLYSSSFHWVPSATVYNVMRWETRTPNLFEFVP